MKTFSRLECADSIDPPHKGAFLSTSLTPQKILVFEEYSSSPASLILDGHESETEKLFNDLALNAPLVSSIGIYRVKSCVLMGQAFVFKNDHLLDAPDLLPDYVRDAVDAGKQWEINPQLPMRYIDERVVVAVSNAYQIYGHWIVDILPRLWLAYKYIPVDIEYSVVMPIDTPVYAISLMKNLFGEKNFIYHDIYKENLNINEILLPSLLHNSHYFHPAINEFVSFVVDQLSESNTLRSDYRNYKYIYVTRQKFRASSSSYSRSIVNENEVLDLMKDLGFAIVSPEDFSWDDQVIIFNSAKIIVGEAGSAMHNTLFSHKKSVIICLNPTNHVQSSIAAIRNQKIMSMCTQFESHDQSVKYTVDIERLKAAVDIAILQEIGV